MMRVSWCDRCRPSLDTTDATLGHSQGAEIHNQELYIEKRRKSMEKNGQTKGGQRKRQNNKRSMKSGEKRSANTWWKTIMRRNHIIRKMRKRLRKSQETELHRNTRMGKQTTHVTPHFPAQKREIWERAALKIQRGKLMRKFFNSKQETDSRHNYQKKGQ